MSTSVHPHEIRPGSIPPSSNAVTPVRRIEPIARRPERRLAGETREPIAIVAALRARMRAALARGDTQTEAQAASRLSRELLEHDTHLDEAVASGRRAIALRPDDDGLRRAVSDALRALGEPGLAAALLRPVVDSACARASRESKAAEDAVAGLLAIGDLLLRAGDVEGALESFRYVAVVAPERPDGQERLAMSRGIAPSAISAEVAARAYIGAAKKHQIAGDDARALEALARAFETDPASPLAANVLADALEELGRIDAADAVRAEHARSLGGKLEAAAVVHLARREKARMRSDRAAVVASVLDELVDLVIHAEPQARDSARVRIDAALEEIPELASARRRVNALLATGPSAVEAWRAVAAASVTPALRAQAHAEVVARELADDASLGALREHARQSRDATLIVDALVRALRHAPTNVDPNLFAARAAELAGWADEQLGDTLLAAWAWRKQLVVAPGDKHAQGELARLASRLAEAEESLARADREAAASIDARRKRARVLLGVPDREPQIVDDVAAVLAANPGDQVALSVLERALRRLSGEDLRRAAALRESAGPERSAARIDRIEAALRRGDVNEALSLATTDGAAEGGPFVVALALRIGGASELAIGLARSAALKPRAPFLAAAARCARAAANIAAARSYAEEAMADGPRELRGAAELSELIASHPNALPLEAASAALERALGGIGARGRWALALAAVAEASNETPIAAAWTRRAWSLRPGDLEVARAWIARAVAVGDPELIAEVMLTTVASVTSLAPLADALANALRALFADDARTGEKVARALLGLGAARVAPVRAALIEAVSAPPALAVATEERWLASGAPALERPRVLLAIAEMARKSGDLSRAADAAARVLTEPETDPVLEERAFALLASLSSGIASGQPIGADAELVLRTALSERAAREARRKLDAEPRARVSDELERELAAAADALRETGRDLWDLADDRDAALRAWLAGAKLLGERGVDRLEADIAHFGGDDVARDALFELTRREDLASEEGGNARKVRTDGFRLRAFERVLTHPPSWLEPMSLAREAAARASDVAAVLPEIEALALRNGRIEALDEVYGIAAGRAAGRFGARGVHYRAARVLDRLGRPEEALTHAVRAFSAVPSEGAMLMMLERLARGSSRADVAVNALVEAAEQATDPAKKAAWLDRAASIAGADTMAPEERFDLLLRLFLNAPTARTAEGLVQATRAAIHADPSSRETWLQRFLRAHRRVDANVPTEERLRLLTVVARALAELDGIDRAVALLAKGAENAPPSAVSALRPVAEEIATRDPEAARSFLDREQGGGVLRAHLAWGAGDPDRAIDLLAEHAGTSGLDGPAPELEYLEKWAGSARDKRAIARAWERFGRSHGPAGDLEAARALDDAGQTTEAAQMLVDAWRNRENAPAAVVKQILELARAILPHAGADAALVEMLEADLHANPEGDAREMIARWREVAELRVTRLGDRHGALEALVEGGRLAPADEELWNEIGELAESIGAHERLAAALAQRLQRARPDKRVNLLRKLARVLEHDLNRDDEAAERWAELVRLLPLDAEAADALERIAERRGDTAELLDLLRARAARLPVGHAERTRALRRVARELGGVQGRRGEVLSALREVHQQNPSDMEVAVQLSHLARSAGDLGTAAEALMRAFRSATRDAARVHLAIEAARVLLELHDHDTASRLLHEAANTNLEGESRALDLVRLQLEVAIARSDVREEALARIRLAELDVQAPSDRRATHFAAAAKSLLSMGETTRAKELAWKAARALPGDVSAAALLAELEFAGGARKQASAEDGELLGLLGQIPHTASAPADALAVVAFARAELLDLARAPGAGYQDLNAWPDEVKLKALVQLALAERLAAEWSFGQAAIAYERAFAGDLRGLRALGPAALKAADAAARSNDANRARSFLDLAARDPACRIDARKRAVELARAVGDDEGALRALERLAAEATGNTRAQALADQARLLQSRDAEAAVEAMRLAVAAADEGSSLQAELIRERAQLDSQRARRSLPPAPPPSLRDSQITSNRAGSSFDRSLANMMGGMGGLGPIEGQPSTWIAPQSESEPPPKDRQPPRVEPPRVEPPRVEPARVETVKIEPPRAEPSHVEPERAAVPVEPPVEQVGPAGPVTETEPRDELTEHPRLTMVGDTPSHRPRSMPALPRPATTSGAIDLATLDKIALDATAPAAERIRALKTLGEASHEAGKTDEGIRHFISALELGDIAAGDQAAELLALIPGRQSDLLLVRRRQVFLAPGDRSLLDGLHEAALGARDLVFARSIDHVRRAFDVVAGPVPPPPLDVQLDRPDLVLPLLERRAVPVAAEALRIAWDNASLLFRKEPGILARGAERVTGVLPIGRVLAAAARTLGTARTPVYLRPRSGRDVEVVLLSPPAVILGGDCREDNAETRYALGAGILAAHPSHCLLLAQSELSARQTWQALLSAFGPPEHGRGVAPEVGRLGAALWQSIPRAAQRRLGELLANQPPIFETALEGARQVARRGGLYVSGDLAAAVRATLAEVNELDAVNREQPNLVQICEEHPRVADLFRLATSPEFAEARWRGSALPQRPGSPSGVPVAR